MSKQFMASTYLKNGQFFQAATLLEKQLIEKPDDLGSLDMLGRAYFGLHKYQDAHDTFAKLHRHDQANLEWTHLLARCLFCLGNYKKAYALASYVVKHEGPTENNLMTRGLSAQKGGLTEAAEADFRLILEGNPVHADALHNLATLVAAKKQFVEAIQLFEKSYKVNPENKGALANAIYFARSTSAWIVERTYASEIKSLGVEGGVISPFSMLALDDCPSRHQARSREFWRTMTQGVDKNESSHSSSDKIRLGYFSSDFYDHATMHLFADVLRHHDRSQFEIFGYVVKNPKIDRVSHEGLALFDRVKDVSKKTDKQIAEIARKDHIDIAVDLKGFTSFSRPAIFAYGAGKVQINYLGYPGTMGTPLMDYIIADKVVIPPSHEQFYDESVLRLPNCYQPNRELRPDQISLRRSDFGLPSDAIVLASFNAIYKVGLEEFLIWLEILKKHPETVLWIISDVEQAHANLLNIAEQQGVSSNRIIRATPISHDQHIARLSLADLFVDTFNVCAHTTASDALRAGLPVITKMGSSFASRVASSILHSCGLDDWIAHSEEEYFQKIDQYLSVIDLETHKTKVRDAVAKSDLFNPRVYTRDLENLYRHAISSYTHPNGGHGGKGYKPEKLVLDKGSCLTRDADKISERSDRYDQLQFDGRTLLVPKSLFSDYVNLGAPQVTVFCAAWSKEKNKDVLLRSHSLNLRQQTHSIFPLYIFDDGDVPEDFGMPHVVCLDPLTIYEAWNLAVKLAPTEYVLNLNLDDRLFSNSVALLQDFLEASNSDLVGGEWLIDFALPRQCVDDMRLELSQTNFSPEWPPCATKHLRLGSGTGERGTYGPSTMWRKSTTGQGYPHVFANKEKIKSIGDALFWQSLRKASRTLKRIPLLIGVYHSEAPAQAEFRHHNDYEHVQQGLLWKI